VSSRAGGAPAVLPTNGVLEADAVLRAKPERSPPRSDSRDAQRGGGGRRPSLEDGYANSASSASSPMARPGPQPVRSSLAVNH
jgi:hypothetical protein